MIKVFWRVYIVVVVVTMLAFALSIYGGPLEGYLSPIRTKHVIHDITRTPSELCWYWSSDKIRMAKSDIVDVTLDRLDTDDRSYPEVYGKFSRVPWHRNGVRPVGHDDMPFCIMLPADTSLTEPLVLHQTIHYHGLWNLWDVLMKIPDVVSTPSPRR